jgi:hypothetical protein
VKEDGPERLTAESLTFASDVMRGPPACGRGGPTVAVVVEMLTMLARRKTRTAGRLRRTTSGTPLGPAGARGRVVEAGQRHGRGVDVVAGGLDGLRERLVSGVPRFITIDVSRVGFCHGHCCEGEPRFRAAREQIGVEKKD